MKRLTVVVVALAVCLVSLPAMAVGNMADIVIYDRVQHRTLPVHVHQGRHYVAGNPGNEYEVRLRNRQRDDILTVVSVDGVDVITGDTADWQQSGYVLGPHQTFGVKGWRKSMERVAAFYFTTLPDSYVARTGRSGNVGVIGVAVFSKKPEPVVQYVPPPSRRLRDDAQAKAEMPAPTAAESSTAGMGRDDTVDARARTDIARERHSTDRLGTGHGRSEISRVVDTEFARASSTPAEIITIYYDSYRNLVAQGVIRAPSVSGVLPQPFPGRFVPDPR